VKSLRILFFSLFVFSISFAQQFEGIISMKISGDEEIDMDYFIKGEKIRIETPGNEEGVILFDTKQNKFLIVMPEQKMYMEMPMGMGMQNIESETSDEANTVFTGETRVINSYECEKWVYVDDGKEVEAWMAKGLGSFFMFQNPMAHSSEANWQSRLEAADFFPMLVIEDNEKVLEVTSVEPKALEADLFSVPAGFQKFDMPGMKPNMYMK
jgi:hypothetical protein